MTLGSTDALSLEQARRKAKRELGKVADGGDPLEAKREARRGATVADLADLYVKRHASKRKRSHAYERRIRQYIKPALGSMKVADVKRADVSRLHHRIGDRAPYEANRVLALVSSIFRKAVEWGLLPDDARNPAAGIERFKEASRERWAHPDELRILWHTTEEHADLVQRCAFRLYLLTGLRRSELLSLRWRDVDVKAREIRLADTKSGKPHIVPLSSEAIAVLKELPRGFGNAYVFPGRAKGRTLVNIGKSWRKVRARAWLLANPEREAALREQAERDVRARKADRKHGSTRPAIVQARLYKLAEKEMDPDALRLHDLRRTVGAMMASSGTSADIVGKVLGHRTATATAVYARIADETKRQAVEEHGARITAIVRAS